MKIIGIFLLLFTLTTGVIMAADFLQGLQFSHTLYTFIKMKQRLVKEDYILIFIFFLPLIISKVQSLIEKLKTT